MRIRNLHSISLGLLSLATVFGLTLTLAACNSGNHSSSVHYFSANDNIHDAELWKTDGTTAGTVMVKDMFIGGPSSPAGFTKYNDSTYFSANDGIHGRELWKTDGTEDGTVLVKDIYPGGITDSSPAEFTELNNTLYFTAYDEAHGTELWKSNGTAAGTMIVKDINTIGSSSPPNCFQRHSLLQS